MIDRGARATGRIDFAVADWKRNEYSVDMLQLSRDVLTGAVTFALRTPPNLVYPEEAHFYDCDEELFQFEGEFHHDELLSYVEGDYVYRPVGTVYGHGEGSTGGLILVSFAREPVRFHFQGHPEPWTGHYLVDRRWNPRTVQPFVTASSKTPWESIAGHRGRLAFKRLRGSPGVRSEQSGASGHSPWAADSAFMLRIPAGFAEPFPSWPDTELEVLVTRGHARIGAEDWYRGCYAFGAPAGLCTVEDDLECYIRAFSSCL